MTDIEGEIDEAIEERVYGEDDIEEVFSTDSGKLRTELRLDPFKAEVYHLPTDTAEGDWFVKVIGPDPLSGGRPNPVWSMSYQAESGAMEGAVEALKRYKHRHDRRGGSSARVTDGGVEAEIDAAVTAAVPRSDAVHYRRLSSSSLEVGDEVVVEVNSRARKHLGQSTFRAEVVDLTPGDPPAGVTFRPVHGPLGENQPETHTWYPDIGYIHGYHTGLERHSDIGKVREIRETPDRRRDARAVHPQSGEIQTVGDIPNDAGYTIVTGAHERDHILDHIGEDPEDWSHGSLFVRTAQGDYTDVLFFPGNVPRLSKRVTRIL